MGHVMTFSGVIGQVVLVRFRHSQGCRHAKNSQTWIGYVFHPS